MERQPYLREVGEQTVLLISRLQEQGQTGHLHNRLLEWDLTETHPRHVRLHLTLPVTEAVEDLVVVVAAAEEAVVVVGDDNLSEWNI